jgi:hypothetical protein
VPRMHTICRSAKPASTIRPDCRGKANDPLLLLQTNQLFLPEQHRYGPFDPIRAKVEELTAARK